MSAIIGRVDDGPDLNPFGELVDGDKKVVKTLVGLPEFLKHVEAQNHEWLGNRDHLERLH